MNLGDFIFELDESQMSERVFVGHHWSAPADLEQWRWCLLAQCQPEDADPSIFVEAK